MSAKEIMIKLGLSHRPTFLYEYLQPTLQMLFVEMTQPDSPRSPSQRYRITTKGKELLQSLDQNRRQE